MTQSRRRWRTSSVWIVASALSLTAIGQAIAPSETSITPAITTTTSLVLVPTLVRSRAGELILGLNANDFAITDDGVEQQVRLEQSERQPLSIVVVMQTGGAAPRQSQNYQSIGTLLDYMAGSSEHEAAVVTFDSVPDEIWSFARESKELEEAFLHPAVGDHGAAILDAVEYAIGLFKTKAADRRRIILLLSQTQDDGSKAKAEAVVRRLGENNISVFSVAFSPEKTWLRDQFTKPRHGNPPYSMPGRGEILYTFDLSTPLGVAVRAMRDDTAAELAVLSGGEHLRFDDARGFEQQMSILANHIPNRYALSFRPSIAGPGFHSINVRVVGKGLPVDITARTGYWQTDAALLKR